MCRISFPKKLYRIFVLAAAPLVTLSLGCAKEVATAPELIRPVKTQVVDAGGDTQIRTFSGTVQSTTSAELAFQVPGLIIELPVKEGQKVAKGDIIARLRPDEFQARLQSLEGQLDQARANLRSLQMGQRPEEILRLEAQLRAADAKLANAQIEFNRAERLLRTNSISRSNYDLAATAYRVAQEEQEAARQMLEKGSIAREEDIEAKEAAVRGLEARVVEASIQLNDTTLRAPFDGVIAQRFVEANQNVQAKSPVVRFQDAQELDIAVDVPETVMATIRRADIVQLVAQFSGIPSLEFPVQIREVAQSADPTTQTFKVRVGMQAPEDLNLLPGMSARVTMTYRPAAILGGRLRVPVTAVHKSDDGEQIVWILDEKGSVSRRKVQLGELSGADIEITEGLQPGERIAIAGVTMLRDGMKVRDLGDALGDSRP
jgi:RND family efflux transporter MFP subunit